MKLFIKIILSELLTMESTDRRVKMRIYKHRDMNRLICVETIHAFTYVFLCLFMIVLNLFRLMCLITVASRRNPHTYYLILCLPEKAGYKMAELIVCFVVDKFIQLLITTEANLSRNARTEVGFIKDELESIRSFLKEADAMAAAADGETANDGVKTWVNQVREAAFYVEDVIDEYLLRSIRHHQHHGFVRFFHKIIRLAKTMRSQDGIVSKVDRIKELIWIQIH
ncbi:unnamed protein product [Malus baccata var. baccata]